MFKRLIERVLTFFGGKKRGNSATATSSSPRKGRNRKRKKSSASVHANSGATLTPAEEKIAEKAKRPAKQPRQPKQQTQQKPEKKQEQKARVIPQMPTLVNPPEAEGKLRFCDLELLPEILAATQDLGFQYCTEIQAKCMPFAIAGKDLAARAQTGTGKTAAFLASTMTNLIRHPLPADRKSGRPRVLVLAPTRELAIQIHEDGEKLGKYLNLNNLVIFGGMDHEKQRHDLNQKLDILVGTPGRILDYLHSRDLDLSAVEVLVIDEADRMLDMGFIPDVRRIVGYLPETGKRQTMLFSATLEPSILRLVETWLKDPVSVASEPEHVVTDLITQKFYAVTSEQKLAMLLSVIREEKPERMIVFGNRKDHNRTLVEKLYAYGIDAELLSGDVAQNKRLRILDDFRSGKLKIIVATDVAARGIHVDGITHVVNYDLPIQPDDYVHRIGRTGRAGATGTSISFVCEYGAYMLPDLEIYTKEQIHTIQPSEEELRLPEKIRKELRLRDSDFVHDHGPSHRNGRSVGGFGGQHRNYNSRGGNRGH